MNKVVDIPRSVVWMLDNQTNAALRSVLYGLLTGDVELTGVVAPNHRESLMELARTVHMM